MEKDSVEQNSGNIKKNLEQKRRAAVRQGSINKALQENIGKENPYLIQPIGLTLMRADLTPMMQRLIVGVVKKFQDKLKAQLPLKDSSPTIFTDDEMGKTVRIELSLSELKIRPDVYDELHEAAKALTDIRLDLPTFIDGQIRAINYGHLFSNIIIPTKAVTGKEELKHEVDGKYNYKRNVRRTGKVIVVMSQDVVNHAFHIDKRYTRYLENIMEYARDKYTGRIYQILSTYKTWGMWKVDYMELRKILGLTITDEALLRKMEREGERRIKQGMDVGDLSGMNIDEDNSSEENGKLYINVSLKNFSDVKRRVLDPSRDKLKALADEGKVDIYYDYTPNYPDKFLGKRSQRGDPETITFLIHYSRMGEKSASDSMLTSSYISLDKKLKSAFGIGTSARRILLERLDGDNNTDFAQAIEAVSGQIEKKGGDIKDLAGYAYVSLMGFLDDWDERHALQSVTEGMEEAGMVGSKETPVENVGDLSAEDLRKWDIYLSLAEHHLGKGDFDLWVKPTLPLRCTDEKVTIRVPNKVFLELMAEKLADKIPTLVSEAWGKPMDVCYSL